MRCTIACKCGRSLTVNPDDRHPECPECRASYAVTITQIRRAETSPEGHWYSD